MQSPFFSLYFKLTVLFYLAEKSSMDIWFEDERLDYNVNYYQIKFNIQ